MKSNLTEKEIIAEIEKLKGLSLTEMEQREASGNMFAQMILKKAEDMEEDEILYGKKEDRGFIPTGILKE